MWPIGVCSVIALTYAVERWLGLRAKHLGGATFDRSLVTALDTGGAAGGLAVCEADRSVLARIMSAALQRARATPAEREKHVEDVAGREVAKLTSNLKPLMIVYLVAPLLGLLGTVWGMIDAFATIAMQNALGKPEMLASGVYQALVTTAAGLTIAIPTVVAYYIFKARVDRFARRAETLYGEVDARLRTHSAQEVQLANPSR